MFKLPFGKDGLFDCSSPETGIYVLNFSSGSQNQVTTSFLEAFLDALDKVERENKTGVLVFTSSNPKFFSNGFDLDHVGSHPKIMEEAMFPLLERLLTFPLPTIALINGHAYGAGVFIAMASDYRIQNSSRGFLCLPEVDMGLRIPPPIAMMIQHKMSGSQAYRTAVLEGKRMKGEETLKLGIVDALGGRPECIALINERNLVSKSESGVYGVLKEDAHKNILAGFKAGLQHKPRM
ncbi:putative carnitinyl-CoA dehydratase [Aaosphaeria arxii CBS 175.79]|uniref:Putative carnitinyl-CoA dehydratase n=1 Tax=Aaosphaeria arxii CBS 175.79 TaxID=1450172 RepID=A0A6A5Y4K9_9PLEO|nr:putative carnitinyl-CoA dehydratase [Aaosphaeria arxii CBS 175.79]KAF2019967.1 putative carnitinyl-CoA dehydratase [Aaosphaeria arxii CBS 175.79]